MSAKQGVKDDNIKSKEPRQQLQNKTSLDKTKDIEKLPKWKLFFIYFEKVLALLQQQPIQITVRKYIDISAVVEATLDQVSQYEDMQTSLQIYMSKNHIGLKETQLLKTLCTSRRSIRYKGRLMQTLKQIYSIICKRIKTMEDYVRVLLEPYANSIEMNRSIEASIMLIFERAHTVTKLSAIKIIHATRTRRALDANTVFEMTNAVVEMTKTDDYLEKVFAYSNEHGTCCNFNVILPAIIEDVNRVLKNSLKTQLFNPEDYFHFESAYENVPKNQIDNCFTINSIQNLHKIFLPSYIIVEDIISIDDNKTNSSSK